MKKRKNLNFSIFTPKKNQNEEKGTRQKIKKERPKNLKTKQNKPRKKERENKM